MELKRSTLAAFTSPALPLAAIGMPLIVYLPPYYAGTLGLDLATVGFIFFMVRLVDLPLDPVLGQFMDNTRSRLGRYRPWAIGGALVLMVGAWMVFMAEPGIGATRAFAQLLLMYLGYSALFVAHYGWAASLSGDYHERSRLFGWVQAGHVLGMIVVLSLPPIVARTTGNDGAAPGIHAMGWFVVAAAPLTVALAALIASERPAAAIRDKPTLADFRALARNRLVRRLLAIDVLVGIAPGITGAMFIFYFEHRLGFSAAEASLLLLFYFVAGFAAAPIWVRLAKRLGKHRAMVAAMLFYCATHGGLSLLPTGVFRDAAFGMLLAGLPYTALYFFPRAMLADVGDVDRLETGLDRNALLQAVLTTTSKVAHAVPIAVIYPILGAIGFDPKPGAANTPDAVLGMTLLFVLAPVGLILGAAWLVARWPHDEKAHAGVQAALAARATARPAE
jgi:Na+/melibiose symporter-like transporter